MRCFHDSLKTTNPIIHKYEIPETKSPVVYLDILVDDEYDNEAENTPDIVAVHEDGLVQILSGDASSRKLVTSVSGNQPSQILMASVLSAQDESERSMKGREDLLTNLQNHPSSGQASRSLLLLVLRHSSYSGEGSGNVVVKCFGLPHHKNSAPNLFQRPNTLNELTNYTLPESEKWSDKDRLSIGYHKATSMLYVSCTESFTSYVSIFSLPRIVSRFENSQGLFYSFQRLSQSTLLAASMQGVIAYDLRYMTTQHQLPEAQVLSSLKLIRDKGSSAASIQFVTYFPTLNSVIAIVAQSLVSFEVVKATTKLVDAIGQGLSRRQPLEKWQTNSENAISETFYGHSDAPDRTSWPSDQLLLDNLIQAKDVDGFENLMAAALCRSCSDQSTTKVVSGLQLPIGYDAIDTSKIDFLINRIFAKHPLDPTAPGYQSEDLRKVSITFLPPRLTRWLIQESHLTSASVRKAIYSTNTQTTFPGLVSDAFLEHDPSLKWLKRYLRESPVLDTVEILHVISHLLGLVKANLHDSHASDGLLIQTIEGTNLNKANDQMDLNLGEVDIQTSPSNHALHVTCRSDASTALKVALRRSDSHSLTNLTTLLRKQFSNNQVIDLVQYLREQLFLGGYTSHFRHQAASGLPSPVTSTISQEDVTDEEPCIDLLTAIRLLSCCLDYLGPLSFVGTQSKTSFAEQIIHQLRDEVSAALGGIEEAKYLQGLLLEVLRYGESVSGSVKRKRSTGGHLPPKLKPEHQRPGSIVTLYATPAEDQGDRSMLAASLPLSLEEDELVTRLKVRKGGGQVSQRSSREKAYLARRKGIGKYSFERLVL